MTAAELADDLDRFLTTGSRRDRPRIGYVRWHRWLVPAGSFWALVALGALTVGFLGAERTPRAEFPSSRPPIALSPDGRNMIVGGEGGLAFLLDTQTGERFEAKNAAGYSAAVFSPDGTEIALGTEKGEVEFWEPETGKRKSRFQAFDGLVRTLLFTPSPDYSAVQGMKDLLLDRTC